MPQQSLIWTVLPNGLSLDGNSLRFSVLVSPRLDPESQPTILKTFADFVSWPKTLEGTTFTLLAGAKSIPLGLSNVDATIGTPDLKIWSALFPDTVFVRKFAMHDRSNNHIVSYDTTGIYGALSQIYGKLTASATDQPPTIEELLGDDSPIADVIGAVKEIDTTFWSKKGKARDVPGMFDAYRDQKKFQRMKSAKLAEFQLFHTPPNEVTTQTVTPEDERLKVTWQKHKQVKLDAAKAVAEIDFHQLLSAMNPYPTLLRKLGIVLDFVVPRDSIPRGTDISLSVTATLPAAPLPPKVEMFVKRDAASPVTHTVHSANAFTPASRPSPVADDFAVNNGLLKLDSKSFALLQADVDGGGHKLMNFARTLANHKREVRQVDPTTRLARHAGAPALRNAGLMLVHVGRGRSLTNAFKRNKTLDGSIKDLFAKLPSAKAGLYAEDLVRGWRFDIFDKSTGKWRSLCERLAGYEIDKGAISLTGLREEGVIRLAATSSTDGSNADLVFLHEAVTVWNGWSLVAQQPGKAIDLDEEKQRESQADMPEGVRLKTSFVPTPGSLPRLRYGREYAIRARMVDLAGNSLPPSQLDYAGDNSAATSKPYLRFEPVQPPGFALVGTSEQAQTPQQGESMARVAVRSMNAQFDDPTPAAQTADRWAVAPRISQREAELHGMFDGSAWGTPQQFALLVERDKELAKFGQKVSAELTQTGPVLSVPSKKKSANPGRAAQTARADDSKMPSYAVLPGGATSLPYLPDPLCQRVVARFLNHPSISAHSLIEIPLYDQDKKWPDVSPVMIHVYEANSEVPHFDVRTRTLMVPTPKGTRATLRLSSMLEPDKLDLMGVWNWTPKDARTPLLRQRAQLGRLWPLTPMRELDIVHAVQRPLLKPDIVNVSVTRGPGDTWVKPTVLAECHRNSTDKVDFCASWNDPRDVAGTSGPVDQAKNATPFAIKITDPQGYGGILEHEVPTGYENRILFGEIKKKEGDVQPVITPKVHDFGDTRYRRVEYQLVGTTRFREYMPADVLQTGGAIKIPTDANITLPGTPQVEWALNSASPAAPEVLYVVPTFGWTRGTDADDRLTSWRKGSGLRVWLDRPWNTTGYGEMLAVVLPPEGGNIEPNHEPYKHVVTQWGNDPIWKSSFVAGVAPTRNNFRRKRVKRDATGAWLPPGAPLSVADQPDLDFPTQSLRYPGLSYFNATGRVDIAPHDVFWDADRRLWYCDIEITHGSSYFPFVRLALARYQPSSLPDLHLSNIVVADFASLAPDRSLSVTTGNATRRGVRVFGFAPDQSSAYSEAMKYGPQKIVGGQPVPALPFELAKTNVIEVWVEKLTVAQGEDFGWHKVAEGTLSPYTQQTTPSVKQRATPVGRSSSKKPVVPSGSTQTISNRSGMSASDTTQLHDLMEKGEFEAVLKNNKLEMAFEWPTLWDGQIELPTAPSASTRYRLVVAEYEEYLADGSNPYQNRFEKAERRLVFVEHVELT